MFSILRKLNGSKLKISFLNIIMMLIILIRKEIIKQAENIFKNEFDWNKKPTQYNMWENQRRLITELSMVRKIRKQSIFKVDVLWNHWIILMLFYNAFWIVNQSFGIEMMPSVRTCTVYACEILLNVIKITY